MITCKICNKEFESIQKLSYHLASHKILSKDYYDKYVKLDGEGICNCGNITTYGGLTNGYKKYCSAKCVQNDPEIQKQIKTTNDKKTKPIIDNIESLNYAKKQIGKFELNDIICQICGLQYNGIKGLLAHVRLTHNISKKPYYDIFFKQDGEGLCLNCGSPTTFHGFRQYSKYCGHVCASSSDEVQSKVKDTCLKHYGVEYSLQSSEVQKKIKQSYINHFGVDNPSKSKIIKEKKKKSFQDHYGVDCSFRSEEVKFKIKEVLMDKYGVDNISKAEKFQQKKIDTSISKYGVRHPSQTEWFQTKIKQTCLKKYGVENPNQFQPIQNKTIKTCLKRYGTISPLSSRKIRNKGIQTNLKKYGYQWWTQSPQGRKVLRENHLKRIKEQECNGEPLAPNIGTNERLCINELKQVCLYSIIRVTSPIHGYFPDGYIKELNLIIEYDERYHFIEKECINYTEKDIQKELNYKSLGYNVYRIKDIDYINDPEKVISQFKYMINNIKF